MDDDKIEETKIAILIKEKLTQEFNKMYEETHRKFLELAGQKDAFLEESIKRMIEQPDNIERVDIVKSILKEKFLEQKICSITFNIDLSDLFIELLIEMIKLEDVRDTIFEEACYKCY